MQRRRLGEILVAHGAIDQQKLRAAMAEQRRLGGGRLGRIMVDLNLVTDDQLVKALAEQHQVRTVDVATVNPPDEILTLVPPELAHRHQVLPLGRDAAFLFVAMSDPGDLGAIEQIRAAAKGLVVQPLVAAEDALAAAIDRLYSDIGLVAASAAARGPLVGRRSQKSLGLAPQFASVDVRVGEAEKQIARLAERIAELEQIHKRDEDLIRQLCLILIEKNVTTKDDIVKRMNRP